MSCEVQPFRRRTQLTFNALSASTLLGILLAVTVSLALADVFEQRLNTSGSRDFGNAVSIDGGRVIVGDPGTSLVHIFEPGPDGLNLVEVADFDGPDPDGQMGYSVSIDGDWAVGGNPWYNSGEGIVAVYQRDETGNWTQDALLVPPDGSRGFGIVDIDGDRILVGSFYPGSAYIFDLENGSWILTAELLASDGEVGDTFGHSVSLRGGRALVGAPVWDGPTQNQGAAYVFELDEQSGTWVETAQVWDQDPNAVSRLGSAVAFDDSGDRFVVGACYLNGDDASAFVYERQEDGTWSPTAELPPPEGDLYQAFGFSVAFSGDEILIGAPEGTADDGATYLFEWAEPHWVPTDTLIGENNTRLGWSVSLDEGIRVAGAPRGEFADVIAPARTISGIVSLIPGDRGDNDCVVGEVPLPGRRVRFQNVDGTVDWMTASGADGSFVAALPFDTYVVSLVPKDYWEQSCPVDPPEYTVDIQVAVPSTADFGSRPQPGHKDLSTAIISIPPRPGFDHWYHVNSKNVGIEAVSASITLELPPEVTFLEASEGGSLVGSAVEWTIVDFSPGDGSVNWVEVNIPVETSLGSELTATAHIDPVETDETPSNNTDVLVQTVVGSYDPNDKTVLPAGDIPTDQLLDYVIRFQNVGTAEAINIVVRDTLDTQLDMTTLDLIAVSHDYEFEIDGRELVFLFHDINLPDSTSNEAASHGLIEFEILPMPDLTPGSEIPNRAGIYFDFNPVVLTNTVINTIFEDTSELDDPFAVSRGEFQLAVEPNPVHGPSVLRLVLPSDGLVRLDLHGVDGRRLVRLPSQHLTEGTHSIEWDGRGQDGRELATGVYFMHGQFESDHGVTTVRQRVVRLQ